MPLTALELWNASSLAPADLGNIADEEGELVIPLDASDAQQFEAAVAWVEINVLPVAAAEVGVPVRVALSDYATTFDNVGLTAKFGAFADEIIPLWDGAQTSFGRSELNKRVDSNSESYDKDSDQDRIQGNQRLQKLLDALSAWRAAQAPSVGDDNGATGVSSLASVSVPVVATW